jgi:hypothetical protein
MTPVRARTRARARTPIAPRGPRRVSGPAAAAAAGAATLPRRTGTTGLFARVRALPDHRVVDRLLRSRVWIWALGLALGGIVTMQVSLLKLNSGISRAVETTTTLERQNADLEASIARLSSPDRIEGGAAQLDMLMPAAGDVSYLTARADDGARAARRMQPPSDDAAALLANHGIVPGSLAAPPPAEEPVAPATTAPAVTEPAPTATPAPSTTTTTQAPVAPATVAGQG